MDTALGKWIPAAAYLFLFVWTPPCLALSPQATDVTGQGSGVMTAVRWSPYAVGFGIGILCWISFLAAKRPLGASTAYARTSGMIERLFRGEKTLEKAYYKEVIPGIGWESLFVAGIVLGSLVSALLSDTFRFEMVPPLWELRFGHTPLLRLITALIGGIIMGIGARWAKGCTSGHGISGTLQLVVSSWVAVAAFFFSGSITAFIIYN